MTKQKKRKTEINYLITNGINATGQELRIFAEDLVEKADCFEESIPVYFAAASLSAKNGELKEMRWCVGGCRTGMQGASEGMIARDVTMKEFVKRHVIPLMHDVKNQMSEVTSVSEADKCGWMSIVLRDIVASERLVDDNEAALEARKESDAWWDRKPWWKKMKDVHDVLMVAGEILPKILISRITNGVN